MSAGPLSRGKRAVPDAPPEAAPLRRGRADAARVGSGCRDASNPVYTLML
jgi:hypothetical protein